MKSPSLEKTMSIWGKLGIRVIGSHFEGDESVSPSIFMSF